MLMVGSGEVGNPTVIAGDNTATIGEKTVTFTLAAETDVFIGLSASGGGQNGVYTTWDNVGVYSQSDFSKMQSLGIGWFSGDSEGFERDGADLCHMSIKYPKAPKYTYAWSGTAGESASTLSKDGAVVATNLFPNPGFDMNGSQPTTTKNVTSGSMSDGVLTLTRVSGRNDTYWLWKLTGLPAGTPMVSSCSMTNGITQAWSSSWGGMDSRSFKVPDDGVVLFAFAPTSDSAATFTKPLLCTAADWNAMQSLGIDWFSGDSEGFNDNDDIPFSSDLSKPIDVFIPNKGYGSAVLSLEGTGGADVYGMTLSVVPHGANDIWWLHHHGNMFRSGNGMVGAQFSEDDFEWTKYSLGTPWAVKPAGFTLIETEWSSN